MMHVITANDDTGVHVEKENSALSAKYWSTSVQRVGARIILTMQELMS